MRSIICISLIALISPGVAVAQDRLCLALDPDSQWLLQPGRSLSAMAVDMRATGPDLASLRLSAVFAGISEEAPLALTDVVYSQAFDCEPGPDDPFAEGAPGWMMPGGWVCAPDSGDGMVQLRQMDNGFQIWTTGITLQSPQGPTPLTTRGYLSVGYALLAAPDETCAVPEIG